MLAPSPYLDHQERSRARFLRRVSRTWRASVPGYLVKPEVEYFTLIVTLIAPIHHTQPPPTSITLLPTVSSVSIVRVITPRTTEEEPSNHERGIEAHVCMYHRKA